MTLAETIYQKSLALPPEKALAVLDFIDFIKDRSTSSNDTSTNNTQVPNHLLFSQRWQGRFSKSSFSEQEQADDPKLTYLAQRYHL